MRQLNIGWILIGWLFFILNGNAALLKSIEVRQIHGKTSLFFSLSQPVPHRVFTLVNPHRVVVDFEQTHLSMRLTDIRMDPRLIKRIRSGQPYPGTLRIVLEVTQTLTPHTNNWGDKLNRGFRLDLSPKLNAPIEKLAFSNTKKLTPVKFVPRTRYRSIIVVLDPGHGGKDPGAHGPGKTLEKNVVLNIAKKLKNNIDRVPGMRAVLTRKGDYYIGLRERLNIARRAKADVFISIHADAFKNPHSSGASVFALSQSGATSEAARWLAEKENYSELGGVNLSGLNDKNGLVRTVLIDLSQTATVGSSLHMGGKILHELVRVTHLHNNHVEQARFVVLKSPDIPSVLIETGFISNPKEERNLRSEVYQQKLSQSIFAGLRKYFWEYPPQGTFAQKNTLEIDQRENG